MARLLREAGHLRFRPLERRSARRPVARIDGGHGRTGRPATARTGANLSHRQGVGRTRTASPGPPTPLFRMPFGWHIQRRRTAAPRHLPLSRIAPPHVVLRPPALPLRVLAPRRREPRRRPDREGQGVRAAGAGGDRSRLHVRRVDLPGAGEEGGDQADPGNGGVRRAEQPARSGEDQGGEGVLPPRSPRPRHPGVQEPLQALLHRLHRGLLLQAPHRPGGAGEALGGAHRLLRLPGRRGRAAPDGGPLGPGARGRRLVRRAVPGPLLPGGAGARLRGAVHPQRAGLHAGGRDGPTGRGHQRRPLPARGRPRRARLPPLHRARKGQGGSEPHAVRRRPLLQERAGDGGALPRPPRGAGEHAGHRRGVRRRVREEVLRAGVPAPAGGGDGERAAGARRLDRGVGEVRGRTGSGSRDPGSGRAMSMRSSGRCRSRGPMWSSGWSTSWG
jgi:hypothetical protein